MGFGGSRRARGPETSVGGERGRGLLKAQEVPTWHSVAAGTRSPGPLGHSLWLLWPRVFGASPEVQAWDCMHP